MNRRLIFWPALFAPLALSRLCHTGIVWEGEALPMAAAGQALLGKTLYRDIWYDKPPLAPLIHMLTGARPGWALRLEGALFALLCCWLAYRLARHLWSEHEGRWAAALMAFFLVFYLPAADIPLAPDLIMLAPHLAAVWLVSTRRHFWGGVTAGVAFWVNPKGVFVAAACLVWSPAGALSIAAGVAAATAVGAGALWLIGALPAYWEQVWVWGRHYAADTFVPHPFRNGVLRTSNWLGFHAALVCAGGFFIYSEYLRPARATVLKWALWIALALAGTAAGMRFFPRYYFLLLAPMVVMASRGLVLKGRALPATLLLLLIPLVRFAPTYVSAVRNPEWRDTAMDRDSREAAAIIKQVAHPGDTLFVWGYRPEMYPYTGLRAANKYLDSQPLTGVPADRHLTVSEPVESAETIARRADLVSSDPVFIADGLSLFNSNLAIARFPSLAPWFRRYREVARTRQTVIYRRAF